MTAEEKVELVASVWETRGLAPALAAVELPKSTWYYHRRHKVSYAEKYAHVRPLLEIIRLTNDPAVSNVCPQGVCLAVERERPVIARVLATTADGADEAQVVADLRRRFAGQGEVWVASTAELVREMVQAMRAVHLLMLAMAGLSFVTSVLGVFAVVYVSVYARRREIGMLKAIGMSKRALVGTFALEAVMLTVSATLAGAVAGTVLGYVFYLTFNLMRLLPTPQHLTFDWLTTLAILVVVILASLISASLAARGVVRSKVTAILRGA